MVLTLDHFIAGWIGGICGLVLGHPLETVKVRQQAFGSKFLEAAKRTYKYEGIPGFYKGMAFPLITVGPANALLFGVYANVMHVQQATGVIDHKISYDDTEAMKRIFIAGTIGGFFQTLLSCPAEVIKTVLQASTEGKGSWRKHYEIQYKGSIDALEGFMQDRGFKGFYRGLTPLLIRDVPTSGLYILTYEMLLHYTFSECETSNVIKRIVAGGTAGVVSWLLVFPFDVVKNRMQVDNPFNPQYKSMLDCFVKSYRAEGMRVFMRGYPATLIRTFPVNGAIFIGYEATLSMWDSAF